MTKEELLKDLRDRFKERVKKIFDKSRKRVYVDIEPEDIADFVKFIFNEKGARFNTATCVDVPNGFEILYHFTVEKAGVVISFRVMLDKENPEIESITPTMKGAEWIEREIHELFGVEFRNHPNLKTLLLPDGWPEGVYPLRRDYKDEP